MTKEEEEEEEEEGSQWCEGIHYTRTHARAHTHIHTHVHTQHMQTYARAHTHGEDGGQRRACGASCAWFSRREGRGVVGGRERLCIAVFLHPGALSTDRQKTTKPTATGTWLLRLTPKAP